jgi:hypothetical protein
MGLRQYLQVCPGPTREWAERWLAPGGKILAVYDEP